MEKWRNMFQIAKQDKTSGRNLNKTELSNLPDKEFKETIIIMLPELGRRMGEHNENFNRVRKYKKEPIRAEECNE